MNESDKQQLHKALDVLIVRFEELTKDLEPAIVDLCLIHTSTDEKFVTTKVTVDAMFCPTLDGVLVPDEYAYVRETWVDSGEKNERLTRVVGSFEPSY